MLVMILWKSAKQRKNQEYLQTAKFEFRILKSLRFPYQ